MPDSCRSPYFSALRCLAVCAFLVLAVSVSTACQPCNQTTTPTCSTVMVPGGVGMNLFSNICSDHSQSYEIDRLNVVSNGTFRFCSGISHSGGCSVNTSTNHDVLCLAPPPSVFPDILYNGIAHIIFTCDAPEGCFVQYDLALSCVNVPTPPDPPTPPPIPPNTNGNPNALSVGAVIGILFGTIVAIGVIVAIYAYFKRTREHAALLQSLSGFSQVLDTTGSVTGEDGDHRPASSSNWIASPNETSAKSSGARSSSPPTTSNTSYVVMLQDYSSSRRLSTEERIPFAQARK
jgi:hypothetical protein